MKQKVKEFTRDRYFVGMKHPDLLSFHQSVDLPAFWTTFTERFYKSDICHLIDRKEAIGYISFLNESHSYEYYAACEVGEFGETDGFEKIVIPMGEYLFFDIRFADKESEITSVLESLDQLPDFCFEFYPETFNHEEEDLPFS
ncbi:GyrI-like domain-containing protein [Halobacillus mangrovi]|uniref:Integron-associated effector binding protein domain-containing protein n=1 Tax=Halobacillus mangrovi TaxID=402384 RepID=A0A1W5ZYX9_9BACI|nr:effector binding domain-containing protein [Halobacillus mangrovi]ARI78545.1 hypothetical protein HM131_17635 [Halobacillus mangrovi]